MFSQPKRHRLGYRLLGTIVLASALLALLTTAVQLYGDYRRELGAIDEQLAQVERSALDSLADSLWSFNETQLQLQLNGLLQGRDVQHVQVRLTDGSTAEAGTRPAAGHSIVERHYPLRYSRAGQPVPLGTLTVVVGLDGVHRRLLDRAIVILVSESAKTLVIALLILLLVNRGITRHLVRMADYARELSLDQLGRPLKLKRKPGPAPDELDLVASALNDMSQALAAELERRAAVDTERAQLSDAFEHQRFLLQAIVDNTPAVVFVKDLQSRFLLVNRRYREVFSEGREVIGHTPEEVLPDRATEALITDQRAMRSEDPVEYELKAMQHDGEHTYLAQKFPLRRADGELFAIGCIATDITERKRTEERIRYLAQHDALTGLPNRLLLRDRITQAITRARRSGMQAGVMFIDLDHFKNINDSLGHKAGDSLLEAMSQRLEHCLREGDTVARLGGDEFVVCLPELRSPHDAMPVADKVLEALRQPVQVGTDLLHVTGSAGIAVFPSDGDDAEALMRAADAAMYHAKEKGRNNVQFFTARLNEAAQQRLSIATRLHLGLQGGEFEMHFQPQVDLVSGRVLAAEALIRWHQADGTVVPPNDFIRVAEETGLILPLGEWILRESCRQAARWHAAGHADVSVAVNLSPQQFLRPGFADFAARVLHETGLPPSAVELEITEGVLMMKSPENMATLHQLAALGLRLAIDDFGTGYSSLAYLQRFPVHGVKIDRSFIDGIGDDANDTAIVTAVIAMAHSLHLQVVAEGVETERQVGFLKAHGCRVGQGYHFSHALPADDFIALLARPRWLAPAELRMAAQRHA